VEIVVQNLDKENNWFFVCGGHGICGKCKCRVQKGDAGALSAQEKRLLTKKEKAAGIRLACQLKNVEKLKLEMLREQDAYPSEISDYKRRETTVCAEISEYGAAFDIGTTTVAGRFFHLKTGQFIMELLAWNPQGRFGADVISRMQFALDTEEGAKKLQDAVLFCLEDMVSKFKEKTGYDLSYAVAAGNPAMTYLLLKESVKSLARKPFCPVWVEGQLKMLSFSQGQDLPFYTMPLLQGQVGGDITAGLLSLDIFSRESGALLADIGTNGELAFWWRDKLYICSTAAGPALEGAGISCGMRAEPGAIEKIWLTGGRIYTKTIAGLPPAGICGSALVDAVAVLLDTGKLKKDGYLEGGEWYLASGVSITQEDIRQYQLVKAAICAGILTLLRAAGAEMIDIREIFVAGAFGSSLRKHNIIRTGLFPSIAPEKLTPIGNASLKGAGFVLLDNRKKEYAEKIREKTVYINLAEEPLFREEYLRQMSFSD